MGPENQDLPKDIEVAPTNGQDPLLRDHKLSDVGTPKLLF